MERGVNTGAALEVVGVLLLVFVFLTASRALESGGLSDILGDSLRGGEVVSITEKEEVEKKDSSSINGIEEEALGVVDVDAFFDAFLEVTVDNETEDVTLGERIEVSSSEFVSGLILGLEVAMVVVEEDALGRPLVAVSVVVVFVLVFVEARRGLVDLVVVEEKRPGPLTFVTPRKEWRVPSILGGTFECCGCGCQIVDLPEGVFGTNLGIEVAEGRILFMIATPRIFCCRQAKAIVAFRHGWIFSRDFRRTAGEYNDL